MKNILFCSAGRRVKLIKDFKETVGEETKIIVAENSIYAPSVYVADKSYFVPKIHDENYISKLIEICKKEDVRCYSYINRS